jgi:hypothetical protein
VYAIADPAVPGSPEWLEARDRGRWPTDIRPYTSGLQNGLFTWRAGFGDEPPAGSAPSLLLVARCPDEPDLEHRVLGILASLATRAGVAGAAYYRELEGQPHLVVVAVAGPEAALPAAVARDEPGLAGLGPVETYGPIARRR